MFDQYYYKKLIICITVVIAYILIPDPSWTQVQEALSNEDKLKNFLQEVNEIDSDSLIDLRNNKNGGTTFFFKIPKEVIQTT